MVHDRCRPPNEFIPPVAEPYQYIIFRASEVKDLAVDDPTPPVRSVHDDPAVLGVSLCFVPSFAFLLQDDITADVNEHSSVVRERINPMWIIPLPSF